MGPFLTVSSGSYSMEVSSGPAGLVCISSSKFFAISTILSLLTLFGQLAGSLCERASSWALIHSFLVCFLFLDAVRKYLRE